MVYSIRNATLEKQMTGHTDSVTCMTLDGNLLFTGSDDCTIRQWEMMQYTNSGIVGRHEERKYHHIAHPPLLIIVLL